MNYVWAILGGAALMMLAAFVAYVLGTKRAIQAHGEPTPAEREIAVEQKAALDANATAEAKRVKEVTDATDDDLLRLAREQLREDAATLASDDDPGKPPR